MIDAFIDTLQAFPRGLGFVALGIIILSLAKLARELPGIEFKGVMSHQTLTGKPDKETRFRDGKPFFQMCLDVKDAIEAVGITGVIRVDWRIRFIMPVVAVSWRSR